MSDTSKPERFRTLLILGAPGSGKGTQGKVLGSIPRFHHLACGDVFRSLDTRTTLGQKFVQYSSRGELVPDDVTVELWRENIQHRVDSHMFKPEIDFLVLDGIPRNVEQAKLMEKDIEVLKVFHLSCPDRTELARRLRKRALKDNRFDDANEAVIQQRFATYEAETKPILDYYAGDRVVPIDASQAPAKVLYDILAGVMTLEAWKELEKMKI
ncbi:MAG: nucleoside monophosphate kinase [Prosthecobacter sp.]|jgi:adenylate kinase|uniref:adenylate kinase family protein n=1 Tax=Prosthecobacter sp. TaxID=1965333 RepID=UPI0019EA14EB|nr:nucleoside monophosphate kinase [Prosthecobacter sp.]MBE2282031.1 nucleoside monophosphate kinase [Prosthecobacter sp.]